MEKNNREKKQTAMKTVGGKKRKVIITDHDDDKKRSWSDLPYEILELIKKGLFFIDQVNFRVVCKSWSCVERVPPLQQIPWLLVFDNVDSYLNRSEKRKEKNIVDSCKLVDSKNKKTYTIDASVIKAKLKITNFDYMKVHESKYGWLLISQLNYHRNHNVTFLQNHTALFLYSPFFSEGYNFIELPVLMNCSTFYATFTSNPLDEDCKILTLSKNVVPDDDDDDDEEDEDEDEDEDDDDDTTILINTWSRQNLEKCKFKQWDAEFGDNDNTIFLKENWCGQGSWSRQNLECKFKPWDAWAAWHWIYSEGSFYYRTSTGTMGKFNLALQEWTVLPTIQPSISCREHYKVTSSDGELFLIQCNVKNKGQKYWSLESRIYRLDLSSMIWEDMDSIGDRVLFYGEGYNSVVDSSVLKLNGERKDISDMIYYCKSKTGELRYCSVHDFTLKLDEDEKPPRKKNCSRHYGLIATKRCRKLLIDPPPR